MKEPPLVLWSNLPKTYHHRYLHRKMLEMPGMIIDDVSLASKKAKAKKVRILYDVDYVKAWITTKVINKLRLGDLNGLIKFLQDINITEEE